MLRQLLVPGPLHCGLYFSHEGSTPPSRSISEMSTGIPRSVAPIREGGGGAPQSKGPSKSIFAALICPQLLPNTRRIDLFAHEPFVCLQCCDHVKQLGLAVLTYSCPPRIPTLHIKLRLDTSLLRTYIIALYGDTFAPIMLPVDQLRPSTSPTPLDATTASPYRHQTSAAILKRGSTA